MKRIISRNEYDRIKILKARALILGREQEAIFEEVSLIVGCEAGFMLDADVQVHDIAAVFMGQVDVDPAANKRWPWVVLGCVGVGFIAYLACLAI